MEGLEDEEQAHEGLARGDSYYKESNAPRRKTGGTPLGLNPDVENDMST